MKGVRVDRAPFQKPERQPEIGLDDGVAVGRGGRRNGAEVHHGVELAAFQPAQQVRWRHEIGELALAEIAPLAVAAEKIVDHDVGPPSLIEARHDIRSDESGPAGDQQHRRRNTGWSWIGRARLRAPLPHSGAPGNLDCTVCGLAEHVAICL